MTGYMLLAGVIASLLAACALEANARRKPARVSKYVNPCDNPKHKCPQPKGNQTRWRDLPPGTVVYARYTNEPFEVHIRPCEVNPGRIKVYLGTGQRRRETRSEMPCKPFDSFNYSLIPWKDKK